MICNRDTSQKSEVRMANGDKVISLFTKNGVFNPGNYGLRLACDSKQIQCRVFCKDVVFSKVEMYISTEQRNRWNNRKSVDSSVPMYRGVDLLPKLKEFSVLSDDSLEYLRGNEKYLERFKYDDFRKKVDVRLCFWGSIFVHDEDRYICVRTLDWKWKNKAWGSGIVSLEEDFGPNYLALIARK